MEFDLMLPFPVLSSVNVIFIVSFVMDTSLYSNPSAHKYDFNTKIRKKFNR